LVYFYVKDPKQCQLYLQEELKAQWWKGLNGNLEEAEQFLTTSLARAYRCQTMQGLRRIYKEMYLDENGKRKWMRKNGNGKMVWGGLEYHPTVPIEVLVEEVNGLEVFSVQVVESKQQQRRAA
jgi:hypothetical protein